MFSFLRALTLYPSPLNLQSRIFKLFFVFERYLLFEGVGVVLLWKLELFTVFAFWEWIRAAAGIVLGMESLSRAVVLKNIVGHIPYRT